MSFKVITTYQPFISRKARVGITAFLIFTVTVRCIIEYQDFGFSPTFWFYAGFAMVAAIIEWRHYHKPREISIQIADGKLEYCNQYTHEMHTVYQSRVKEMQEEEDSLVFYSQNNYATRIPLKYFQAEQIQELKENILDWKSTEVAHAE